MEHVKQYFKLFFNCHLLLLIPSFLYIHFTMSLANALFPRAYLSCYLGAGMIGYVSMARGITGLVLNLGFGLLGGRVNVRVLLLVGYLSSIRAALGLLLWDYFENNTVVAFSVSILISGCLILNLSQMPGKIY